MSVVLFTIRDNTFVATSHRAAVPLPASGPYWIVNRGILVATNHKLWAVRLGQPVDRGQIEKALKLT